MLLLNAFRLIDLGLDSKRLRKSAMMMAICFYGAFGSGDKESQHEKTGGRCSRSS
jgi:hypothetical protein